MGSDMEKKHFVKLMKILVTVLFKMTSDYVYTLHLQNPPLFYAYLQLIH